MGKRWEEIFRAGEYPQGTFTEADLDAIAAAYDPQAHEAPVVCGHPADNAPAYGWVSALRREGDLLQAQFSQVNPDFESMVKAGSFKKRSSAFYKTPEGWYLRHVGFLGAQPPQVKGLKDVRFAEESETVCIEFEEFAESKEASMNEELDTLKAQVEALGRQLQEARDGMEAAAKEKAQFAERASALEADLRMKTVEARLDKLQAEGRVTPAERSRGLAAFLSRLDSSVEVEFAEAAKTTPADFLWQFLEGRPPVMTFGEIAVDGKPADQVDPITLADMARAYAHEQAKAGNIISMTDAVAAVQKRR